LRTARRRAEAMNLVKIKKNLHAEAVIYGPHSLRKARRRAEAMNLVKVKKLTCRGRHIRTPTLEDGQKER
jgi:hypothetical protein